MRSGVVALMTVPLAVLTGLGVGLLAGNVAGLWACAVVGAGVFLVVFLERPDLGLLAALLIRSFSDLTVTQARASTPGQVLSSPLNIGLVLIVIFAGGVFLLRRGLPIFRLPGGTPFAVLLLTGLVALVHAVRLSHSQGLLYSFESWLRDVSALVVYALAAYVFRSPRRVQGVIDILAGAFVITATVGFYEIIARRGSSFNGPDLFQITGTFTHQNLFGIFLVFIMGVFFCQALVQSGMRKYVDWSIVAASMVLLLATYARSAWLGATVALTIIGVLRKRVLLVLVPLLAVIAIGVAPSVSERLADPFGGSFADRQAIWRSTVPEWLSETNDDAGAVSTVVNRLIGTGPGSVSFLVVRSYGIVNAEHNDYLRVLLDYGIVGLVSYLWLLLAVLVFAYRTWRASPDIKIAAVPLSFVALIPSFMVMSITENIFGGTQNQLYFWTLAGLTVAIHRFSVRAEVISPLKDSVEVVAAQGGRILLPHGEPAQRPG